MTDDLVPDDHASDGAAAEQPDFVAYEPVTFEPVAFGDAGPSRRRRAGRAVAWVAAGAVGATVLTGVAFAASRTASTTPSPAPSSAAPGYGAPGGGEGMGMGGGMGRGLGRMHGGPLGGALAGGPGAVLHGDLVVKTKSGATKDVLVQTGSITAASTTSITVKSSDGFVGTWALGSSTKVRKFTSKGAKATAASLAVGDSVLVAGTKTSATSGDATVVSVTPTKAQLQKLFKNGPMGHLRGRGPGGGSATPNPTATGSTTGQSTDDLGLDPGMLGALGV